MKHLNQCQHYTTTSLPPPSGWLLQRPPLQNETIYTSFEAIWVDLYNFITQSLSPKMPLLECMYIKQAINLLEGLIPGGEDEKNLTPQYLSKIIVFAIMWSLGALLELDDRRKVTYFSSCI